MGQISSHETFKDPRSSSAVADAEQMWPDISNMASSVVVIVEILELSQRRLLFIWYGQKSWDARNPAVQQTPPKNTASLVRRHSKSSLLSAGTPTINSLCLRSHLHCHRLSVCSPHVECDLDPKVETLLHLNSVYRDGKFTFPREPLTDVVWMPSEVY